MVGRIAPWKGQHVFIEAFARAFPTGPERAVIIGTPLFGEDAYERELHELVDAHELRSRIEFAGFRDDVQAELARLDVLVHASVTPEPFGLVVIEGMASGLPVVASAEGGPLEVIEHGVNGLLAPAGDADALARELARLAVDAELRSRLGAAARLRARAFHPGEVSPLVVDLYRRVLHGGAVRRARYKRGRHDVPVLLGSARR
jgi:glycosyltransferase involved in cell wall biosynthesis